MRLLVVLALWLPTAAGAQTAAPDVVALRFGWPAGMEAEVEATASRVRTGDRSDSTSVTTKYTLSVGEHPMGRLVRARDLSVEGPPAAALGEPTIGSLMPDLVVGADGTLLDIANADALLGRYRTLLGPITDSLRATSPEAAALMDRLLSHDGLLASAGQMWTATASFWAGADLEVGEIYVMESEEPIPLLPGKTVAMVTELSASERVPCVDAEEELRCVLLEYETYPDEDAMRQVVASFLEELGPETAGTVFESLWVVTGGTAVTEPETLRPHYIETYKMVEAAIAGLDGEVVGHTQTDVKTYVYTYE